MINQYFQVALPHKCLQNMHRGSDLLLQAAQQERSTFVTSLMPLLAEYSLQPADADAQSIVSNVKVIYLMKSCFIYCTSHNDSVYTDHY